MLCEKKARPRWFGLTSLHKLHVWWSYRGSRALGTNSHFLSFLVDSEKKFMVWGEDKLKGSAQANSEQNRQRFERKKNRPVPILRRALANWRRALANWRRALANWRRALANWRRALARNKGSSSGHYKLGTGPIPWSSMYIDHTLMAQYMHVYVQRTKTTSL